MLLILQLSIPFFGVKATAAVLLPAAKATERPAPSMPPAPLGVVETSGAEVIPFPSRAA